MTAPVHVERLRALLAQRQSRQRPMLSVPGCWDALTALLIEQAGMEAAFLTGGGLSMARLGRPDLGLTTASELVDAVMTIRDRVALPLIVDGDTGFGGTLNLQRTLRLLERAGASAVQIEDQGFPKRCGHLAGKTVVPLDQALGRLRGALDTRESMLVIARTDAVAIEGLDAALDRAEAYLAEGADLVFVEGAPTMKGVITVAERFANRCPLVHNLVEGGVSGTDDGNALDDLGYAIALHPLLLMHGLAHAAPAWLAHLKQEKSTVALRGQLSALADMNRITGAAELLDLGAHYEG